MDWRDVLIAKAEKIIQRGEGKLIFTAHNEKGFVEWKIEGGETERGKTP